MSGTSAPQPHVNVEELQSQENRLLTFLAGRIPHKYMIHVGAHHGTVLEPFLIAGWKVDAFEPMTENREVLIAKFGGREGFRAFAEALSNTVGQKELQVALNPDGSVHEFYHTLENLPEDEYHKKGPQRKVPTTTIDELIAAQKIGGTAGFLKIDTEGHDLMVLQGASSIACDVVSVEFWSEGHPFGKSPSPPESMIKLMMERGYRYYIAVSHSAGGDVFHYSSHRFGRDAWGNLFFFRTDMKELYEECVELCSLIGGREKNLHTMFALLKEFLPPNLAFADVGAFRGEFSAMLLEVFPLAKGLLFEPTRESFDRLQERFLGNERIRLLNIALEKEEGKKSFFTFDKAENNSLLQVEAGAAGAAEVVVPVATLDGFLGRMEQPTTISILKTDTQGCDLRVLEGSVETIRKHRPIVYTEVTFIPQYKNQDDYFQMLKFMADSDYRLAGVYNVHQTVDGLLAFADFLFLPAEIHSKICESGIGEEFTCSDSGHLIEQNRFLESTCQEQLRLIEELKEATDERGRLIGALKDTAEERALQLVEKEAMINALHRIADERSRVIHLINEELETIKSHWAYRLAAKMKRILKTIGVVR